MFDELEHVLFYFTDVIYRAIPPLYESLENAMQLAYGEEAADLDLPIVVRFGSWIGGDIEARPDTTGRTIREVLARQRSLILNLYFQECRELAEKLSQSTSRIAVSDAIKERIRDYTSRFPNIAGSVSLRYRDMPYRTFLTLMLERLQSTYDDDVYPYENPEEFLEDIKLIAVSLEKNKGRHAGLFSVQRLSRRVKTFGFHFLALDIRQSALVNRAVVGDLLGEDNWMEQPAESRTKRIQTALEQNESPAVEPNNQARRALGDFPGDRVLPAPLRQTRYRAVYNQHGTRRG